MTVTESEETNPETPTAVEEEEVSATVTKHTDAGESRVALGTAGAPEPTAAVEQAVPAVAADAQGSPEPEEAGGAQRQSAASKTAEGPSKRKRNLILFALVAAGWFVVDAATKAFFDAQYQPNQAITDPIMGIFQFRLVHNTGAAWGMFGDSTFFLGIMSSVVCILLVIYMFYFSPRATVGEVIGLALVFAGGIGNAINRFTLGYVVDFIEPTFIDFPVFNVADIGVTCGFILFLVSFLFFNKDGLTHQEEIGEQTDAPPSSGSSEKETTAGIEGLPSSGSDNKEADMQTESLQGPKQCKEEGRWPVP